MQTLTGVPKVTGVVHMHLGRKRPPWSLAGTLGDEDKGAPMLRWVLWVLGANTLQLFPPTQGDLEPHP